MAKESRFVLGIDLGTTNSALAFVDTLGGEGRTTVVPIPQIEAPGRVVAGETLPSFLYIPTKSERNSGAFHAVGDAASRGVSGVFGREQAPLVPGRVVHSAKSWLSHAGVDRLAPILPWRSEDLTEPERLSPVDASAEFLRAIKHAWDTGPGAHHPEYRLEMQQVIVTVPASFDEVAQRLTLDAAKRAGFSSATTLLEEPQAVCYRWLEAHREEREVLEALGQSLLLVCDIGGGTTDLSLFRAHATVSGLDLERIAVSEHLLLGGDNLDLLIAHVLARRFRDAGHEINARQWSYLLQQSRTVKEDVLSGRDDAGSLVRVALPASGARLFGGSAGVEVSREELRSAIIEGFFPICDPRSIPQRAAAGARELGLPYASDSAVTRHLAAFLNGRAIDAVLWNGGTLNAPAIRARLNEVLQSWQPDRRIHELSNPELDVAVARGAAWFGFQARTKGERIRAGYPHSVYLEVGSESSSQLLCIVPLGSEIGSTLGPERILKVRVNQPVRFQAYYSLSRPGDAVGAILTLDADGLRALAGLQTRLDAGASRAKSELVDVRLEAHLSETGLLRIGLIRVDDGSRWELEFNVRKGAEKSSEEAAVAELSESERAALSEAIRLCDLYFGKAQREGSGSKDGKPQTLLRDIETAARVSKEQWSLPFLRSLWAPLQQGMTRRGRSPAHEVSWLGLAGFCLRPGYGAALDAFRMSELWRCHGLGLAHPKESRAQVQWWIMWRRVAGGLSRDQQLTLAKQIWPLVRQRKAEYSEALRLACSLERLTLQQKRELAAILIDRVLRPVPQNEPEVLWGLTRLGARIQLYAGQDAVVPPADIEAWFEKLSELDWRARADAFSKLWLHAARVTGELDFDVREDVRDKIYKRLRNCGISEDVLLPLRMHVDEEASDRAELFGEVLPVGLIMG